MGLQNNLREEALSIVPPDKLVRTAHLRYHKPVGGLHIPFSVVESIGLESHCSLILAGDSFSEVLGRFLSPHFRRTLRLRPEMPYAAEFEESLPPLIEAEKPDVYIELVVDRNLFLPPAVVFASKEKVGN